ncbi:MAG: YeeE/YedE thiosulfate transporter family protein [Longimicrobiales bacterium]|nr:YeeE/YedE thiosulfate transporter family protein [Longimicrobiales bacterium]
MELLTRPWPWYVAGPIIGLAVPLVYLYAGRKWGVSSTFRDVCAATFPKNLDYFAYSWRDKGASRSTMVVGLVIGGLIAGLTGPDEVAISEATRSDLAGLGITDFSGLVPSEIFSWSGLLSPAGFVLIVVGGFLVGFGTRYANGCTSGHAISGLSALRVTSLVAVLGFFAGGLIATHLLLPLILGGGS